MSFSPLKSTIPTPEKIISKLQTRSAIYDEFARKCEDYPPSSSSVMGGQERLTPVNWDEIRETINIKEPDNKLDLTEESLKNITLSKQPLKPVNRLFDKFTDIRLMEKVNNDINPSVYSIWLKNTGGKVAKNGIITPMVRHILNEIDNPIDKKKVIIPSEMKCMLNKFSQEISTSDNETQNSLNTDNNDNIEKLTNKVTDTELSESENLIQEIDNCEPVAKPIYYASARTMAINLARMQKSLRINNNDTSVLDSDDTSGTVSPVKNNNMENNNLKRQSPLNLFNNNQFNGDLMDDKKSLINDEITVQNTNNDAVQIFRTSTPEKSFIPVYNDLESEVESEYDTFLTEKDFMAMLPKRQLPTSVEIKEIENSDDENIATDEFSKESSVDISMVSSNKRQTHSISSNDESDHDSIENDSTDNNGKKNFDILEKNLYENNYKQDEYTESISTESEFGSLGKGPFNLQNFCGSILQEVKKSRLHESLNISRDFNLSCFVDTESSD